MKKTKLKVIVQCANCDKEIIKTELQAKRSKKYYCSVKCRKKYIFCIECGKELITLQDRRTARGGHVPNHRRNKEKGHCLQCWRKKFSIYTYVRKRHSGYKWCPKCKIEKKIKEFSPKSCWCHKCENEKHNKLIESNPQYKLRCNVGRRINFSLKDGKNGRGWEKLVGYTAKQLIKHLEKQFGLGMSWDNYGEWHIDHEIPVSVFNFIKPEDIDFKRCWALSNLQPMWAYDNLSKGSKINKHFQPYLQLKVK